MSAGTAVEQGFADEVIGAGERAAACLMSGQAHGIREIIDKYGQLLRDEDPEEDPEENPEEEPDTEETEPDARAEEPEEDPEEPDEPEEDPEEPEEEPEPDEAEMKDRIARRCAAMAASVANALAWMQGGL